ncbi:MBL fold metallo-hydrolase [Devosia pacifica]|uniref:MBL fold metallo-hydrolase n=1 Tax=Devosia pacifica TaxID=1335967 RepID=A0A918RWE5_9HYPH|nr:MBL fold metallo-hydrolase [Devosia pacifica]GHA13920.1 MBL fold metallo-hydrolase [Devosia pacifica]
MDTVEITRVAQDPTIDRQPFTPDMRVSHMNDYLICFYDGREIAEYPAWLHTNIDMQLGLCCYVLHRGEKAIIFDTMLYREHIIWIDAYLEQMGVKHVSVINSHWDCDHIAGNFLYKNRDIISTSKTRLKLEANAEMFRTGEIWAMSGDPYYPGVEEVILPNRTFDGRMTLYLDDIRIDLIETFVHQIGHLVAYLPQDQILLAGDACEDTVPFNAPAMTSELPIQLETYRELLGLGAKTVYPCHGRFEVIDGGGYTNEFIAAMLDYNVKLLDRANDEDFLSAPVESFIQPWLDRGVLALHEPYRALHRNNLKIAKQFYGGRSKVSTESLRF